MAERAKKARIALRCPECDSAQIRHLARENVYWCRRCGWRGPNVVRIHLES